MVCGMGTTVKPYSIVPVASSAPDASSVAGNLSIMATPGLASRLSTGGSLCV